ncbi:MAG: hypothetical protein AB7Q23_13875 [Hyphomonadaceae bacterium]
MRRLFAWIGAACALVLFGAAAPNARVDYTLTPLLRDGALEAIQVDLRFRAGAGTATQLKLPNTWAGETDLWRVVQDLEVVSGGEIVAGDSPWLRDVRHRPNARLHVRYRIVQDFEGEPMPTEQGNPYRPIVQPTYFQFIGNTALVEPALEDMSAPVRIRTRNLPRGWSFASDLQHDIANLDRVGQSVTVGGDFRVLHAADRNIRVAIRGEWNFKDADFVASVDDIIAGQRRFWGDPSTPYLVTVVQLTPPSPGHVSIGGTGLEDAFAFFATANGDPDGILRTLAHEAMHTWIPGRLGGLAEEDEALGYWFSEGFTEFYTARLLVREGAWGPEAFAANLNQVLAAYAQSPAVTEPNSRILADFWNDSAVKDLPYQRGRLLALLWDARLRARGRDMDDVMFALRDRARTETAARGPAVFAEVAAAHGLDVSADMETHVERGALILLPADALAPCGAIVTQTLPRFHRGFDIQATQANDNVITGVNPRGPAYAAGMRDGMVLLRRDAGEIGDATQEIAYVVRDGERERTIRYMPVGEGAYQLQRFDLASPLEGEDRARCIAVLGGG